MGGILSGIGGQIRYGRLFYAYWPESACGPRSQARTEISLASPDYRLQVGELIGRNLISSFDKLAASASQNHLNIDLGVSSASVYLAELKTVRNFVTHPNRETAATYAQLAASRGLTKLPPEHFLRLVSPGGATTFETWTQRINNRSMERSRIVLEFVAVRV